MARGQQALPASDSNPCRHHANLPPLAQGWDPTAFTDVTFCDPEPGALWYTSKVGWHSPHICSCLLQAKDFKELENVLNIVQVCHNRTVYLHARQFLGFPAAVRLRSYHSGSKLSMTSPIKHAADQTTFQPPSLETAISRLGPGEQGQYLSLLRKEIELHRHFPPSVLLFFFFPCTNSDSSHTYPAIVH